MSMKRIVALIAAVSLLVVGVWLFLQPTEQSVTEADLADLAMPLPDEVSNEEMEEMFEQEQKAATMKGFFEHWSLMLGDENGDIPPDGLSNGLAQVEQMRANQLEGQDAGINRSNWTELGPGNIGGAINEIIFSPDFANDGKMWLAAAGGGIWKSENSGQSFEPVADFLPTLAIESMVIDPANPSNMYVGTGSDFGAGSSIVPGQGIFKSTDGGNTWNQLSSTQPSGNQWYAVMAMSIAPGSNGQTILASGLTNIFRSENGGTSWADVSPTTPSPRFVDVEFDPTNGQNAIASDLFGRAWYSQDGGQNWNISNLNAGVSTQRIELEYAPSDGSVVYANVDVNKGTLYRSADGGQTYSAVNTTTGYLGTQGWVHTALWVSPLDPNTVIVGGLDLWRSTDGGANLTQISNWTRWPRSAHGDHRVIVSPPNFSADNRVVYFGNDGGLYRTQDYTTVGSDRYKINGWEDMNKGLRVTQFYGIAINSKGVVVGGTQDNGDVRYAGQRDQWTKMAGGDGGYMAADPFNDQYFYGEYVNATIRRSGSGGNCCAESIFGKFQPWDFNQAGVTATAPSPLQDAVDKTANFIAPFVIDPQVENRLLVGGLSLWRTNEVKKSVKISVNDPQAPAWSAIKDAIGNNKRTHAISAIAIDPADSNRVWVGHNNGNLYKSINAGSDFPDWTQVDENTPALPNRVVTRVTVDPTDTTGNTVYVTFGRFFGDNLYRTTDGGSNWSDVSGNLPSIPIYDLLVNPNNQNWLYAATELGVFTSEDRGANWKATNDGPSNVRVTQLVWKVIDGQNRIYAATFGRGVYMTPVQAEGAPAPTCYTLTVNADANKYSAAPPPNCENGTKYLENTKVTLQALAGDSEQFTGWSGDLNSTGRIETITMDGDKSITPAFSGGEVCYTLTINYQEPDGSFSTIDASPQPNCSDNVRYTKGTQVTLTATPDTGLNFSGWEGGLPKDAGSPATLTMTKDETVTGIFAAAATNNDFDNFDDLFDNFDFGSLSAGQLSSQQDTTLTATLTADTTGATAEATDPETCENGVGNATVWYKLTPPIDGFLYFDTSGTSYDTSITVFEGDDPNTWELIECDDDSEDEGGEFDDSEDFFDDPEFDDLFEDDFFEDDFFDEDFFEADDFFDFFEEDDFFYDEFEDVSEDQLGQLEVFVFADETYYIMVTDVSDAAQFQQIDDEDQEFGSGLDLEDTPQGGLLVLNSVFTTIDDAFGPPNAPTTLKATVASATAVDLTWADKSTGETEFRIERSLSSTSGFTEIATVTANTTTYSDTGLTENTTYYYRVRAYRADDQAFSSYSNVASATPSSSTNSIYLPLIVK